MKKILILLCMIGFANAGVVTEKIYITPTANGKWASANVVLTAKASGILNVAGTVSASAFGDAVFTDISATATTNGFSTSGLTKAIYVKREGKRIEYQFFVSGTSDGVNFQVRLPYTSRNASNAIWSGWATQTLDNGASVTGPAVQVGPASPTVSVFKTNALGTWTGSGVKQTVVNGYYYTD